MRRASFPSITGPDWATLADVPPEADWGKRCGDQSGEIVSGAMNCDVSTGGLGFKREITKAGRGCQDEQCQTIRASTTDGVLHLGVPFSTRGDQEERELGVNLVEIGHWASGIEGKSRSALHAKQSGAWVEPLQFH